MKKIFDRSIISNEKIAESLLLPTIAISGLFWLLIFWNETAVKIIGEGSIGMAVLISGVVLTLLLFPPAYVYGLKMHREKISNKQLVFNIVTLTIAVAIMVAMVTVLGVALMNNAFKGLELDKYTSAAIVGLYSGVLVYSLVPSAIEMNTTRVVRVFSVVMVCGVMLSMLTAGNPLWWQENFSSLGSETGISAIAFNFTLILSGFILIVLSSHLLDDLKRIKSPAGQHPNIRLLKILFIFIGLCMAGVGFFPYAEAPLMHNFSAYAMVLGFGVMIVGLKKILPFIDAAFLTNSFFILGFIAVCYLLFTRVEYLNLTAFEMIAFGTTFAWLLMFTRKISSLTRVQNVNS